MFSFLMKKKDKNQQKIKNPLFQKNLKGKVIFIRHGETNYNIDFNKKGISIKADTQYIDGHLNATGEQQALKASKNFESLDIEDVYVSPLYRAIQTATLIFKNHPKKENIIIHVHPLLTEVVSSVNNFSWDIDGTKKIFNMESEIKVDWSIFDNEFKTPQEQNFYYCNYIDLLPKIRNENMKKKLYDSYGTDNVKQTVGELGKLIIDLNMKRIESLEHLFKRAVSFKNFLHEKYGESLKNLDKKIVIISHSCFGQMFTSKECYNKKIIKEYPKDCCDMNNCEAVSVFI